MKKLLFIIFVTSLLILSACNSEKKGKTPQVGFIGGTSGLVSTMNIVSSKQNEVLDNNGEPFQITVNLKNKGEHKINSNEILTTLTGVDLNTFQIAEPEGVLTNQDELEKSRVEAGKLLPPAETTLSYEANYKFDEPADKIQNIGVNICYKYETVGSADACLRREVTKPSSESQCKIEEIKKVGNSGAPVQITSLTQRPSGKNKLSLNLQIENLGKGRVYATNFLSKGKCLDIDDINSKNKINIKIEFPEKNPPIQCGKLNNGNEGTITMYDNKATLSCSIDTTNIQETTFTKSLLTTLNYVYKDSVTGKITIRNSVA